LVASRKECLRPRNIELFSITQGGKRGLILVCVCRTQPAVKNGPVVYLNPRPTSPFNTCPLAFGKMFVISLYEFFSLLKIKFEGFLLFCCHVEMIVGLSVWVI
jgi:hypothetical protein